MSHHLPDEESLRTAVMLACRAPSLHNTQPWRWVAGESSLHLYADRDRALPVTDPDGRDLVLSCGAALHHMRVALAGLGWHAVVHRLPNPAEPDHLAALRVRPRLPTPDHLGLAAAITRRRTDRRRMTSWPVPPQLLEYLREVAREQAVHLHPAEDALARHAIVRAAQQAARHQHADPAYTTELALWTARHAGSADGVRAAAQTAVLDPANPELRPFPGGRLAQSVTGRDEEDASALVVLATEADDRAAWLTAGEGLSAVLLAATSVRLATTPLTQPLEVAETRAALRTEVLRGAGYPQVVVRLGWAPTGSDPVPESPRRSVGEVLSRFPTA
ncbi:nitroreductase [Crossiella equi]|uniref:Nitroreductase n=1 Tax=Crossiella equi TaxID=130796 RepID=A0ABS5A5H7_9PSEU|nr:hypothetical protein [Crossiella equi]MBP2471845.1 nitroreductase [Crossiella equi]